jgi:hypothetical protein
MTVTSRTDGAGWPEHRLIGADGDGGRDAAPAPSLIGDPETSARIAAGVSVSAAVQEALAVADAGAGRAGLSVETAEVVADGPADVVAEVVAEHAFVRRAQERRRQRRARWAVGAGLAAAAALSVGALLTARTPPGQPSSALVPSTPPTAAPASGTGAVATAGLAPSIEPPPTSAPAVSSGVASAQTGSGVP